MPNQRVYLEERPDGLSLGRSVNWSEGRQPRARRSAPLELDPEAYILLGCESPAFVHPLSREAPP